MIHQISNLIGFLLLFSERIKRYYCKPKLLSTLLTAQNVEKTL